MSGLRMCLCMYINNNCVCMCLYGMHMCLYTYVCVNLLGAFYSKWCAVTSVLNSHYYHSLQAEMYHYEQAGVSHY